VKPVAIFRHYPTEGPGYFASALERAGIPYEILQIDRGAAVPATAAGHAGLAFMGGPMSVNDELPWIPAELALIRDAVARGVPVIGHCLGGQLMSKALGGTVSRNPTKEIGWGDVTFTDVDLARAWLGAEEAATVFHWHGETFSIPPGARRFARSAHCENQMFALGPHLGMQCHIEMTPELITSWCDSGAREIARSPGPAVQQPADILAASPALLPDLHALADRIYRRWFEGLR
jgi:GMP synthase-like glutamine amidotransferase